MTELNQEQAALLRSFQMTWNAFNLDLANAKRDRQKLENHWGELIHEKRERLAQDAKNAAEGGVPISRLAHVIGRKGRYGIDKLIGEA